MSSQTQQQVVEGSERDVPSKLNIEGQNATNPDSAIHSGALPSAGSTQSDRSGSTATDHDHEHEHDREDKGKKSGPVGGPGPGGKPKMEKYAYHC